jgi:hypothetical protein
MSEKNGNPELPEITLKILEKCPEIDNLYFQPKIAKTTINWGSPYYPAE